VSLHATIAASDPSEAQVLAAYSFLDGQFGDSLGPGRASSRAATPIRVRPFVPQFHQPSAEVCPKMPGSFVDSPNSIRLVSENSGYQQVAVTPTKTPSYMSSTSSQLFKKNNTKSAFKGESIPPPTPRRIALQRPSVLPNSPDISSVTVQTDPTAEYAILISMYEVYNDRIFDLLTPASRTASTKDFRRRPLLFKPTEQSPDRKVVAGLRKIICGTMREALMVLEAGLHERRVAGTGSNSVSSRSHGFFCVEVKKRRKGRMAGPWGGSALTIVDLAGSERARDAKTQGATLAEAGKINESLMYLGQCLQMQSDPGNNTKVSLLFKLCHHTDMTSQPNLVPYRQCKLTELLFSNSFPSSSNSSAAPSSHHHRNPQKAIMIVTADPVGDFNATSQILRYSALAREITVPRIPSVTSTILASGSSQCYFSAPGSVGRMRSPTETERETMEIAALEIARMSEEIDGLRAELMAETQRRMEAEAHLSTSEERMLELEMEIREECFQEMEKSMAFEMERWKARWAGEMDRADEHVDRKLEILTRGIEVRNDEDKENERTEAEELQDENERLRHQVAQLQRELQGRSPSKRSILGESRLGMAVEPVNDMGSAMQKLRLSGNENNKSPVKKMKKLTARKWDMIDADEML
jgi:hypothetical protein